MTETAPPSKENKQLQVPLISSTTPIREKNQRKKKKMKNITGKEAKVENTEPISANTAAKPGKRQISAVARAKKELKKAKRKERREVERNKTENSELNSGKKNKSQSFSADFLPSFIRDPIFARKFVLVNHPSSDSKWFELEGKQRVENFEKPTLATISAFRNYAEKLLEADTELFSQKREKHKPGETNWLRTVSSGGTTADKVAALTLLVQESPVHSLHHLESLLVKLSKKSRRETFMALDTIKELFTDVLLPHDRKLESFDSRPLLEVESLSSGNRDSRDKRILLWYFEGRLKDQYKEFLVAIEKLCHDSVDATRTKAIRTLVELLTAVPEQEQFLLSSVVNKLGDQNYKVAAKVVEYLSKVLESHPNMKSVIVNETERLLYRPNISQRAQFYGLCFLSQMMLKASETDLAVQLLNIYFNLFKLLVKKGEIENRMLSQLLAGTNRAFPYAKGHTGQLLAEIDTLYKVVAIAKFGTALQTLMVLFQVLGASEGVSDRYYCALYRKLSDINLHGSSHHPLLFNLLYKTLRADSVDSRVKAFLKKALQLALHESPAFTCGVLLLVSELRKERPELIRTEKMKEIVATSSVASSSLAQDSDEDDEHFEDVHGVDSDVDDVKKIQSGEEEQEQKGKKKKIGWIHRENQRLGSKPSGYDPWHRNPLFACAEMTLEYELQALVRHYHPSVQAFAETILNGKAIDYGGDPLQDFAMMRFLDRFVYRKPKLDLGTKKSHGEEAVTTKQNFQKKQRIRRKAYDPWGAKKLPVGSEEYAMKKETDIPADERFLHRFVTTVGRPKAKQKSEEHSDAESVDSDEFESLLEKFEPGHDNEEFDIDFSKEFSAGKREKQRRKKRKSESDEEGMSEEEEWSEEGEEEDLVLESDVKKGRKIKKRRREEDLFASAEQFAELLEEKDKVGKDKFKKKPRASKFGPKYKAKKRK